MNRPARFLSVAAASFAGVLLFAAAASGDPLHKFAKQDAYWHHGSGWVYPRDVAGLRLEGSPTQIDGNDDVTADYSAEVKGARRKAIVDVYFSTSPASGAKLDTAAAAVAGLVGDACETSRAESAFAIDKHPEIKGVKVSFTPGKPAAKDCSQATLYFFPMERWIVAVRTTAPVSDTGASKAFDQFVRALRWDTLGTDPFDHDTSP